MGWFISARHQYQPQLRYLHFSSRISFYGKRFDVDLKTTIDVDDDANSDGDSDSKSKYSNFIRENMETKTSNEWIIMHRFHILMIKKSSFVERFVRFHSHQDGTSLSSSLVSSYFSSAILISLIESNLGLSLTLSLSLPQWLIEILSLRRKKRKQKNSIYLQWETSTLI